MLAAEEIFLRGKYLETIYRLQERNGVAKTTELAKQLKHSVLNHNQRSSSQGTSITS